MNTKHWNRMPVLIGVACLTAPSFSSIGAKADVRYVTEMKMDGGDEKEAADEGQPAGSMQTTTYIKDRRERVETNMNFGPFKKTSITITQCDKQQTLQIDPKLKIYTVAPIGGPPAVMPANPMGSQGRPARQEGKPGEAHVINTFSVKDMGTEKIGDLTTHHAILTTRTQTSGCMGDSDTSAKIEVWTGSIKTFYCPERYASGRTVPNERGCKVTYETKGDTSALKDIFGGMIVQQKIYQDDKVTMTLKLKDYSQDALNDSLFQQGADFKEVSAQEFEKAQQKAMMDQMLHGGGKEDADASDTNEEKNKDNPPPKKKKKGFKIPGLP